MRRAVKIILVSLLCANAVNSRAEDVVTVKNIGMELGRDLVNQAVLACRGMGYQVSAVVVDRNGLLRASLRDDLAARFTLQIAEEKANAAIMSGIDSGEFRKNRQDIRQEMNHVKGILMMEGGIIITSGGYRIGALGVSGAPGGDKDAVCAKKAIKSLEERLEFGS
ncbi:MAG: heme-binding protein [Gammaproteobacteria bacterium]|nr:heme-binding protein [Gammaproteobacteria bacterium]